MALWLLAGAGRTDRHSPTHPHTHTYIHTQTHTMKTPGGQSKSSPSCSGIRKIGTVLLCMTPRRLEVRCIACLMGCLPLATSTPSRHLLPVLERGKPRCFRTIPRRGCRTKDDTLARLLQTAFPLSGRNVRQATYKMLVPTALCCIRRRVSCSRPYPPHWMYEGFSSIPLSRKKSTGRSPV
ncbi:hypothetical protein GQ53DRAFT_76213 [Thozetella sp. PMI_491]|nr:hypothetical protein GQ53DRAFT_76213 [Thozetella sp. PMI_491]